MIKALKFIIAEHHDLYALAGKEYLSGIIFSYGHNLCLGGRMVEGRTALLEALYKNPFDLKILLTLVACLAGSKMYSILYDLFSE